MAADEALRYPINEIFETVQGEAHWTGTPSVFVRLQFCDVGCPWCDTKYTWTLDEGELLNNNAKEIVTSPDKEPGAWAWFTHEQLLHYILSFDSRHVVFTGGEPAAYKLGKLMGDLHKEWRTTQIETSGTYPINLFETIGMKTWVTVSPKIGMLGGKVFLSESIGHANEIKIPVGKPDHYHDFMRIWYQYWSEGDNIHVKENQKPTIWLQPLSMSKKATNVCMEMARIHGHRISIQTHKYLGVR